jgi:hypothetical protein
VGSHVPRNVVAFVFLVSRSGAQRMAAISDKKNKKKSVNNAYFLLITPSF